MCEARGCSLEYTIENTPIDVRLCIGCISEESRPLTEGLGSAPHQVQEHEGRYYQQRCTNTGEYSGESP